MLPDNPAVSLTHGDLWRGNVVDGRWVIDPEVSFADRELDLACMRMSEEHPLPTEFWAAYQQAWPIPPDFETRRRVLGLHHRLLQVRHFGDPQLTTLHADQWPSDGDRPRPGVLVVEGRLRLRNLGATPLTG